MSFVIVDRNAIHANDQDGGDRATIVLYPDAGLPSSHHELAIRDRRGNVVGTFQSNRPGRTQADRPHVWFELGPGAVTP